MEVPMLCLSWSWHVQTCLMGWGGGATWVAEENTYLVLQLLPFPLSHTTESPLEHASALVRKASVCWNERVSC